MRWAFLLVLSACAVASETADDDTMNAPDAHSWRPDTGSGAPQDSSYTWDTGIGDDDGSSPDPDSGSSNFDSGYKMPDASAPDGFAFDASKPDGGCNACPINEYCCNNIKSINYGKCVLKNCLVCCQ